jgi:hypothetical protein
MVGRHDTKWSVGISAARALVELLDVHEIAEQVRYIALIPLTSHLSHFSFSLFYPALSVYLIPRYPEAQSQLLW